MGFPPLRFVDDFLNVGDKFIAHEPQRVDAANLTIEQANVHVSRDHVLFQPLNFLADLFKQLVLESQAKPTFSSRASPPPLPLSIG